MLCPYTGTRIKVSCNLQFLYHEGWLATCFQIELHCAALVLKMIHGFSGLLLVLYVCWMCMLEAPMPGVVMIHTFIFVK